MRVGVVVFLLVSWTPFAFGEEPAAKVTQVAAPVETAPSVEMAPVVIAEPAVKWSGQVEFGLNAAEGNSEFFNLRSGFAAKREGPGSDLKLDAVYNRASLNGLETQNQLLFDARNEWKLRDSPWRLYVLNSTVYDEFQDWDLRVILNAGVGYQFLKTPTTSLLGRFGPGVAREIGGSRNEFIPEANLGIDFEHKLSERQSLTFSSDYYPSFLDISDYRVNTKAAWECCIDPEKSLFLKVGLLNRYQSEPGSRKPNDLNYFTELVWKF